MKDTNLVSWWCLNTKRGWPVQKAWRGLKITSYVMSVRHTNGVQCHLPLNLQSSDRRYTSGSSLYRSRILSQRTEGDKRERKPRSVCLHQHLEQGLGGHGWSRKGDREERRKNRAWNYGCLGTKKWKVLLQNITVLVLLSTDCRPTMACYNKVTCICTALNSC